MKILVSVKRVVDYNVKVRVKSVASAMLGMDMGAAGMAGQSAPDTPTAAPTASTETAPPPKPEAPTIRPLDVLRGIFGR